MFVDIGAAGRCGDARVFNQSKLKSCMDHNDLNFPEPQLLQSTAEEHLCSYHIVGDDAFSLRTDLMKPYPHKCLEKEERILNYRLSRARRVVENAFGILANRSRLFFTTIALEPENVDYVV